MTSNSDYNERMQRAGAFEETANTKGWDYLKSYYQNQVQSFVTRMLLEEERDTASYDAQRRELIGLRKFLGQVTADLDFLRDERKKNEPTSK